MPSRPRWHQDNIGRLMGYCASRFNRADYLDAWAESFSGRGQTGGDHGTSASLQFLPWVQAHLWQARLGAGAQLSVLATHFGDRTFPGATLHAPDGARQLAWRPERHVAADRDIALATRILP